MLGYELFHVPCVKWKNGDSPKYFPNVLDASDASMSGIVKGFVYIAIAASILLGGAVVFLWLTGFISASINEALFRSRLSKYAAEGRPMIRLSDLADFDWDMVCDNHPYDEPVYLEKFGRTYEAPLSSANKGVSVLLFVANDGSGTHLTCSCAKGGARIKFNMGCLNRNGASLILRKSGECPEYEAVAGENYPEGAKAEGTYK